MIGFLDEFIPIGQPLLGDIEVIGRPSDLVRGSVGRVVDEYLLVPQALPHERLAEITRLMVACDAPTVRMAVSSSDLLTHGLRIAGVVEGRPIMEPHPVERRDRTQLHVVGSMHERKALMASLADAFVLLPGGYGSWEEFCEVITWAQSALKKVYLVGGKPRGPDTAGLPIPQNYGVSKLADLIDWYSDNNWSAGSRSGAGVERL